MAKTVEAICVVCDARFSYTYRGGRYRVACSDECKAERDRETDTISKRRQRDRVDPIEIHETGDHDPEPPRLRPRPYGDPEDDPADRYRGLVSETGGFSLEHPNDAERQHGALGAVTDDQETALRYWNAKTREPRGARTGWTNKTVHHVAGAWDRPCIKPEPVTAPGAREPRRVPAQTTTVSADRYVRTVGAGWSWDEIAEWSGHGCSVSPLRPLEPFVMAVGPVFRRLVES